MERQIAWCLSAVLATSAAWAQPFRGGDSDADARRARLAALREASEAQDAEYRLLYGNDDAFLVRPGLLADRTRRTVTLRGYATGLGGNDPIEFFVIGPASGKAYESLAVSMAKPSDVRAGLEFIGVPPGRGVNYLRNRFFPKGERVRMTFRWRVTEQDGTVSPVTARAEELLLLRGPDGTVSDRTLPLSGLVFTGGVFLPPSEPGGAERFFADEGDPGSIASNYNEPTTVLDLPVLARQSEVYRSRVVNPAFGLTCATPVEIVLEPERGPADPPRVIDLRLDVEGGPELPALRFTLTDPATGESQATSGSAETVLGVISNLVEAGREPFVQVSPGPALPLGTVRGLYGFLGALQAQAGLRIEPPEDGSGHLFFEAFLPDERFRTPENRVWQPVELRLSPDGTAVLRDYSERTLTAPGEARFTFADTPVPDPEALRTLLAERLEQRRPLAIFAQTGLTYGDLLRWTQPAVTSDWIVWVYLEP